MTKDEIDPVAEIYKLVEKLKAKDVTEADIARYGGMTRQAINTRLRQPKSNRLGFGFAVLSAAMSNGFIDDALSILHGRKTQSTTRALALQLFPDLNEAEFRVLETIETNLDARPLPVPLIKNLIETYRAPKP